MTTLELDARRTFRFGWLYNRNSDIVMFVVPFFATIALCMLVEAHMVAWVTPLLILFVIEPIIGSLHGSATWLHYLDHKNLGWYGGTRKRVFLYLVAPVLVFAATVIGDLLSPTLVFFAYCAWTIQHLTQQNIGILLLYRKPGDAQVSRTLEARSLQLAAASFGIAYFCRLAMAPNGDHPMPLVATVFAINSAIALVYMKALRDQMRAGNTLNLSALIFWMIGLFMWIPLLAGPANFYLAVFLPLMVHWCQYIGLNWKLMNSKYNVAENRANVMGGKFPPMWTFAIFCTVYVGAIYLSAQVQETSPNPRLVHTLQTIVMALGMAHYFQDAFIWRFREPFLRETVLPYVRGQS